MGKLSRDMSESTKAKAGEGAQITTGVQQAREILLARNTAMDLSKEPPTLLDANKPADLKKAQNPTEDELNNEAAYIQKSLESSGVDKNIANAEAERYKQLLLKENKTEEDLARLKNIPAAAERAQNLEGVSSEQFSPAMTFCHQWAEKAEKLKGKEKERATQMSDMFRALATTQNVEPKALTAILERKDISGEQKKQIKAMFLPSIETANELAQQGLPKPKVYLRLNKSMEESRKKVFSHPKLAPILMSVGLSVNNVKRIQETNKLQRKTTDRYYEKGDIAEMGEQNERARNYADNPAIFAQETYAAAEQSGYFNIAELNSMAATISTIAAISALGESEGETEGGAEAAAQAQLMRDIENQAREDQERADEANKLIADLMEQAEESSEETAVGDLKDDELKKRLEEMGVEQDKTIKQALEFTNKTMETLAVQQNRVDTLKQNAVVGLEPSFHENPNEVLEMNGIMKEGELTEFGQSVMPDILRASGGSFNNALDQIMDAVPIEGREEFMEKTDEARVSINEYLANPENAEMREAAAEILVNPEFVAIRAAFNEGLADNAADVLKKLNAE